MSDRARASGFGLPSLVKRPNEYSSSGKSSKSRETSWEHHQVMASKPGVEVSDAIVVVIHGGNLRYYRGVGFFPALWSGIFLVGDASA